MQIENPVFQYKNQCNGSVPYCFGSGSSPRCKKCTTGPDPGKRYIVTHDKHYAQKNTWRTTVEIALLLGNIIGSWWWPAVSFSIVAILDKCYDWRPVLRNRSLYFLVGAGAGVKMKKQINFLLLLSLFLYEKRPVPVKTTIIWSWNWAKQEGFPNTVDDTMADIRDKVPT